MGEKAVGGVASRFIRRAGVEVLNRMLASIGSHFKKAKTAPDDAQDAQDAQDAHHRIAIADQDVDDPEYLADSRAVDEGMCLIYWCTNPDEYGHWSETIPIGVVYTGRFFLPGSTNSRES